MRSLKTSSTTLSAPVRRPARCSRSSSLLSPDTKRGRANCSRSEARPSMQRCRASAAFAVELTADELELCKATVFDGCSEDSTSRRVAHRRRRLRTRRRRLTTRRPLALYSAPAVNTLLGTLGLTPSASFGGGVTVAVIDSGIYPSAAFGNRIKAFYDFTGGTTALRSRLTTTVTARTSPV